VTNDTTTKAGLICEAIRAQIAAGRLLPGSRLSSAVRLAAAFGVSRGTIRDALLCLEQAGDIRRVGGHGFEVGGRDVTTARAETSTATLVANHLGREILLGTYRVGDRLPLAKALCYRYETSPTNVRAALGILLEKRLIQREGRGYLVGSPGPRPAAHRARQVAVLASPQQLTTMFGWRVSRAFLRGFERELTRYGVRTLRPIDPRTARPNVTAALSADDTLGILYPGPVSSVPLPDADQLAAHLVAARETGLPVVWRDRAGVSFEYPALAVRPAENLFMATTDHAGAGRRLGAYLASLGHRAVAFFGFFHGQEWSTERLNGFVQGFRAAAPADADVQYYHPAPTETASLDEGSHAVRRKELADSLQQLFRRHRFRTLDPFADMMWAVRRLQTRGNCYRRMAPLFRQALVRREITAWACASELIGTVAAEFLRAERVAVPRRISLAAIDNDVDAAVYGMTTYDFQRAQAGYLAAHCMLGDLPIPRTPDGTIQTPGRIVVRASTARPGGVR